MAKAWGPETRMMLMAASPTAVETAAMVSVTMRALVEGQGKGEFRAEE